MSATIGHHAVHQLLTELRHADVIIKAMLNAMTIQQKSKVHKQLDGAGVSGEGMTRAHERHAVIAAAEASAAAPPPDNVLGVSQQLSDIKVQAIDVISQADHAKILLRALFDVLDELGESAPGADSINCFATCTARAVTVMREAAGNIVALVAERGVV